MDRILSGFIVLIYISVIPFNTFADYDKGIKAYSQKNYQVAYAYWLTSANQGDANSQYQLARLYENGLGTFQSYGKAYLYYDKAASQGNADAAKARSAIAEKINGKGWSESSGLKRLLVNHLLIQATADIAAGRLANDKNNNDAMSRYQQVLKIDPNNQMALEGAIKLAAQLTAEIKDKVGQGENNKTFSIAYVTYGSHQSENVEKTSHDIGQAFKDSAHTVLPKTINIVDKGIMLNENYFVDTLWKETATNICEDSKATHILGAIFDRPSSGGVSESLYLSGYDCKTQELRKKRYDVYYGDVGNDTHGGAGMPGWLPGIREAMKRFLVHQHPIPITGHKLNL